MKYTNITIVGMNIKHFKLRFIYTNNIFIQITTKVNMRFFFVSVYFSISVLIF